MSTLIERYFKVKESIDLSKVTLVVVSKFQPLEAIKALYDAGHTVFGENRVQELLLKKPQLPADIEWHLIGHLQRNKAKDAILNSDLIHSVDSLRLLEQLQKEAQSLDLKKDILLQAFSATEETKYGFTYQELEEVIKNDFPEKYPNLMVKGLMGMGTQTTDIEKVRSEFKKLHDFYKKMKATYSLASSFSTLSMGMSGDYEIAIEEGSTMVRVGSRIFRG